MQPDTTLYSVVLFPEDYALGEGVVPGVNPMKGKGSPGVRTLASLLFVMWLVGAMFVALIFLGSLSWDHRFGHPPYAIWGGTFVYVLLGLMCFRGSHRSVKMFQSHIEKLKAVGFEPELELVGAECYAGFSRAQNRIITLNNVHNIVTELPLTDVDGLEVQANKDHNGWVVINLLTRRMDLPRVCLKVSPENLADWKARLRIVLAL